MSPSSFRVPQNPREEKNPKPLGICCCVCNTEQKKTSKRRERMVIESYVVVHNIAKRHNVGTLARSATAFGVTELILVGRRDFNAFGSHGSTSHLRFRHFHSLLDARNFLKVLSIFSLEKLIFSVYGVLFWRFWLEILLFTGEGLWHLWCGDSWWCFACKWASFQEEHGFPSRQRGDPFWLLLMPSDNTTEYLLPHWLIILRQ